MKPQYVKIDDNMYTIKQEQPDEVIREYKTYMGKAVKFIEKRETNLYRFYIFRTINPNNQQG